MCWYTAPFGENELSNEGAKLTEAGYMTFVSVYVYGPAGALPSSMHAHSGKSVSASPSIIMVSCTLNDVKLWTRIAINRWIQ